MTFIAGAHACIGYRFSVIECVYLIITPLARKSVQKGAPGRCPSNQLLVQDQSSLVHAVAHIRVRIGYRASRYHSQDWDRGSSFYRVKSFRGASVAAVDSTSEYGLIAGDNDVRA